MVEIKHIKKTRGVNRLEKDVQLLNNNGVARYGFVVRVGIRESCPCRRIHEDDIANLQCDQTEMKTGSCWHYILLGNLAFSSISITGS